MEQFLVQLVGLLHRALHVVELATSLMKAHCRHHVLSKDGSVLRFNLHPSRTQAEKTRCKQAEKTRCLQELGRW